MDTKTHIHGQSLGERKTRDSKNCAFCTIQRDDQNSTWILNLTYGSLFLNLNQSYLGRCLYVPFEHYKDLSTIDETDYMNYNQEVLFASNVIRNCVNADLVNIAMLGNKVAHVHWHIIPRYKNDPNWGNPPWPNDIKDIGPVKMKALLAKIRTAFVYA